MQEEAYEKACEIGHEDIGEDLDDDLSSVASTSGAGNDAEVPSRRIRVLLEGSSEGTQQLIHRCAEVIKLYLQRRLDNTLSKMRVENDLKQLLWEYEIPSLMRIKSSLGSVHVANLRQFLEEISDREEDIGSYLWDIEYLSSSDLFGRSKVQKTTGKYRAKVVFVLREVSDGVSRRDWGQVALAIRNMQLLPNAVKGNETQRVAKNFSHYLPTLYLATLQRYLEMGLSSNSTTRLFRQAATQYARIFDYRNIFDDNAVLYAYCCVVFQLANGDLPGAAALVDRKWMYHNPEWNRIFSLYRYCTYYEKWLGGRSPYSTDHPAPDATIANLFITNLSSLIQGAKGDQQVIGLLPMYIHLSKILDQLDELAYQLEELCDRSSFLIGHIDEALRRFALDQLSTRLITKYLDTRTSTTLRNETLLDMIEERSMIPKCPVNVIIYHLQLLFHFLDQGRNRADMRAWQILLQNLECISLEDLNGTGLWQARSDWWPEFHSISIAAKEPRRARREVLRILRSLDDHSLVS